MKFLRLAEWLAVAGLIAFLGLESLAVRAHDGSSHEETEPKTEVAEKDASAEIKLHDLEMVNERGKPVRFVSDALDDQIVAIDFVYTTCTTVCPVLSSIFAQVQSNLGSRLDGDVRMISISIEPVRDTPQRLATYANAFDTGSDWLWLTGKRGNVNRVLTGLGAYSPDIVDHPPMVVIGDASRGVWRRLFGFPSPEEIVAVIDELAAARAAGS